MPNLLGGVSSSSDDGAGPVVPRVGPIVAPAGKPGSARRAAHRLCPATRPAVLLKLAKARERKAALKLERREETGATAVKVALRTARRGRQLLKVLPAGWQGKRFRRRTGLAMASLKAKPLKGQWLQRCDMCALLCL